MNLVEEEEANSILALANIHFFTAKMLASHVDQRGHGVVRMF